MTTSSPLSDLRVVDASHTPAGRLLGCVLAEHGAEVVRSDTTGVPSWTDRSKVLVPQSDLSPLLERADVWIGEDLPASTHPGLLRVALPSFPDGHPLAGIVADGSVVAAACGVHEVPLGRRPAYSELALLDTLAMAYALNGVLGALLARERDGAGQDIVVPLHDVAYPLLRLNALFTVHPPAAWPSVNWAATPFFSAWRGQDGAWLYIHVALRPHLARFLDLVADDPLAKPVLDAISDKTRRDPSQVSSVREALRIRRALRDLFASRPAADWVDALSSAGLCAVLVGTTEGWRSHPHALASEQVVDGNPGPAPSLDSTPASHRSPRKSSVTSVLRRWRPLQHPVPTETRRPPLLGLRVLDLSQVIAGPAAGRTLAELGAEVIHIRNPHFDGGWVPAFHAAYNAGKQQRTLDLKTHAGREELWCLLKSWRPDVVLHNFRPGAPERMGIGEASLREHLPDVILAHLTAYGDAGPLASSPGWEQTAQALTGIQDAWGEDSPDLYPLPCNDLGTGLLGAAAVQLALVHRRRGGRGQRVGAALSLTSTWLQAPTLSGEVDPRDGSRLGRHALHHFYQASDGWLFLSASSAVDLRQLEGLELLVDNLDLATQLAGLIRKKPVQHWLSASSAASGVVVVPRVTASAFLKDPSAEERGLVQRRGHRGLGVLTETTCPVHLNRTPTVELPPAISDADLHRAHAPGILLSWLGAQTRGALAIALSAKLAKP